MKRSELEKLISEQYGVNADHPFEGDMDTAVFRHKENRKWFALIMRVNRHSLCFPGEGEVCCVNLKCPPILIGSLLTERGFLPAYHMNKQHWVTAVLEDGFPKESAAEDTNILAALEMSFNLTAVKRRKNDH